MKYTINDFLNDFPDDQACLAYLFKLRYAGKRCAQCKHYTTFHKLTERRCYSCSNCGLQVYPTAGTIFHKSTTGLKNWFFAIFLMSQSRNGVSAMELMRQVGVTYKTAWRMQTQIRKLMVQSTLPLFGEVEVDEAYVGGRRKGPRGRGAAHKTPVVGMVERGGRVKAVISPVISSATLSKLIRDNVDPKARVITDDLPAYKRIAQHGYRHDVINHSKYQYVLGDIYTNTIEGFWSQLKRSLRGTHVSVSPAYLQAYVDEFVYRYNHRKSPEPLFAALLEELPKARPSSGA